MTLVQQLKVAENDLAAAEENYIEIMGNLEHAELWRNAARKRMDEIKAALIAEQRKE